MGIELPVINNVTNKKNIRSNNLKKPDFNSYSFIPGLNKFFLQNSITQYHQISWGAFRDIFLRGNSLYAFHYLPVNSSASFFINTACIRKTLERQSVQEEFPTFKIRLKGWISHANSLINSLIAYYCKNIFVHFSEKTIFLSGLDK
jgi:hypothetical protein